MHPLDQETVPATQTRVLIAREVLSRCRGLPSFHGTSLEVPKALSIPCVTSQGATPGAFSGSVALWAQVLYYPAAPGRTDPIKCPANDTVKASASFKELEGSPSTGGPVPGPQDSALLRCPAGLSVCNLTKSFLIVGLCFCQMRTLNQECPKGPSNLDVKLTSVSEP